MMREQLMKVIAEVTDKWDESLDDVHDLPPIVDAILARYRLIDLHPEIPEFDPAERDRLMEEIWQAKNHLAAYVRKCCGPKHQVVQHRDGQPAWCKLCGRTADGILVKR